MRKRPPLLSAAAVASFVCVVLLVLAMLPPQPGVTKANFDMVKLAMTEEEINEIFGEPPLVTGETHTGTFAVWRRNDKGEAYVNFRGGRVTEMDWTPSTESVFDRIRGWFRL